jgi:methyltransferase (TIGR00027 family)
MSPLIENVSDTARWVAMYRAQESSRPDALFHDPFAERLAGERGRAILEGMPGGKRWGWPMVVRTVTFDRLIEREVAAGADCVVNLAAGLDMRPYRLNLPASLKWVEVDLPAMTAEKQAAVANDMPKCSVTRIAADLADPAARRDALARAMDGAKRAMVVSEGLLIYLHEADVAALARDLAARPEAKLWLSDISAPILLKWMAGRWGKVVAEGGAPFRFAPENGAQFFEPFGWKEREFIGSMKAAVRLKRTPPFMWLYGLMGLLMPSEQKRQWAKVGYVLLERT